MRILHSKKLIFISKPRCGSTSVRRFLDSKMMPGDEKCDYGNEYPGYPELHPHMSAPAVLAYLKAKGVDTAHYTTFTITRNPIAMLWSYYKYFKPDINYNYNYSKNYQKDSLVSFEKWLENGYVGIGLWKEFCPAFVVSSNFSPLSLEAHSLDNDSNACIDKVFKIEELDDCVNWLKSIFGGEVSIPEINASGVSKIPEISKMLKENLLKQFPMETDYYGLGNEN